MFAKWGASLLFKLLPWVLLVVAIVGSVIWIKLLRADNALLTQENVQLEANFQEALGVNKENQATITELRLARIKDREATRKEQERKNALGKTLEASKKEMRNAPNANDPASSYFDGLANSLRRSNPARGHEDDN
jgi:hypothetical protein